MKRFQCNGVAGLLYHPEEVKDLAALCGCSLYDSQMDALKQAYPNGEHEPVHFEPFTVRGQGNIIEVTEDTGGGWTYHVRVLFGTDDLPSALRVLANMIGETEDTLFAGGYELSGSREEKADLSQWATCFKGTIMQAILFLLAQARE